MIRNINYKNIITQLFSKENIMWILLMWTHLLIMYIVAFDIDLDNFFQYVIIIISPLSTLFIVLTFKYLFKSYKNRLNYILIMTLLLNFILYANKIFYTFFNDFITIPLLFQTSNFSDLGSSSTTSLIGLDIILYFIPFLFILCYKYYIKFKNKNKLDIIFKNRFTYMLATGIISILICIINLSMSESERPELLTRSFDREIIVKNINLYNYHLYDLAMQIELKKNRASASSTDYIKVFNTIKSNKVSQSKSKLDNLGLNKNIILINLESLQQFMLYEKGINKKTQKEEYVLPYLRTLMTDKDTLYFDNFYPQIGQGKTSDSEFIIDTGLYPSDRGAVFFTNGDNKYSTLTQQVNKTHKSLVFHANDESFWNRNIMYQALGVNKFYDVDSYTVKPEDSINWGLKDKQYFSQSTDIMSQETKNNKKPFYAKMITLTNHYPFILDDEDASIEKFNTKSKVLNDYAQTSRYLDESIKSFFINLKKSGLYDNSIVIMYGDHRGISPNHNKGYTELTGREVDVVEGIKTEKTPFYVHIPNSNINAKKEIQKVLTSEQDIRPIISSLLNIDTYNELMFGENPIDKDGDSKPYVMLRDGRLISVIDDNLYYKNSDKSDIYDDNGLIIEDKNIIDLVNKHYELGNTELKLSDEIIKKDLLRFK